MDRFAEEVAEGLSGARPVNPRKAIRAVFGVLSRHVPRGQMAKVQQALPDDLRASWMSAEERVIPPPEQGELGRYRA